MTVVIDITHRLGDLGLDVRFGSAGRLTALFGPSGSGKTTLINMIAGLIRPEKGRIEADGRVLVDTDAGLFVPKHKRRIGMVFQDARLFPHMSVASNLRYGRWFAPAAERYADMNAVVDLLGIGPLLDRRPAKLSGGEKQRVAIGRALLASPRLLLMDEPLASLDDARKAEILPYIERLRDETKIPIVYVSHSISEVARLASDVVVLAQGKVAACGPTGAIMQRLDLLPAEERGEGGAVLDTAVLRHDEVFGMTVLGSAAGDIRVPLLAVPVGAPVRIRIRARDVMIAIEQPTGLSALNILPGTIVVIKPGEGPTVEIGIDCNGATVLARITEQSRQTLKLRLGRKAYAVVKTVSFDRANTSVGLPVEADG
ncbi:molybdenum ABC transporter ATP-binding protein [Mesorhizobium sp.]|uniref:molybdenum ABC transporter ATP-binding protein n=1 Tax=Mesorhizobium sp. TaxID=1871066 RepID=UPI000FE97C8D|nr:molybdenum ABC transporter ATP-binding protein [Mesorhizobium sp.]RWD35262.1 MAG: molybdenum ABC transporter ATP-binding protein [Mesorhizobium sp.]RWD78782.1 MAG: molybdenum ABC transporter ATP-binding protein [Mesorhizobium sp.]RWE99824.1 MAG: molybdenum ABC transporter ATP-binding protein [Mesorhizobium sp.]TIS40681.1 MAG: molybdenum ABC transporter ATP-binding protein [Mesorhizobium sp.]